MATVDDGEHQIFVSYRRDDTSNLAGRLADRINTLLGDGNVFFDSEEMEAGDFRTQIRDAIEACKVMLVVVGPDWLGEREDGSRRIDHPNDFVRLEIEMALERGIHIVPVLVQTTMPDSKTLPETISEIPFLQAEELRPGRRFATDVNQIIATLLSLGVKRTVKLPAPLHRFAIPIGAFFTLGGVGGVPISIMLAWQNVPSLGIDKFEPEMTMSLFGAPIMLGIGIALLTSGIWCCCGYRTASQEAQFLNRPIKPIPAAKESALSFSLGLISIAMSLLTSIPAVYYGRKALKKIRYAPHRWGGRNLALQGIAYALIGPIVSTTYLYVAWHSWAPYANASKASNLEREGDKDAAMTLLDCSIKEYPWCSLPYKIRGEQHFRQKQFGKCVSDLENAIDRYSDTGLDVDYRVVADLFSKIGDAKKEIGDTEGAAKAFERAKSLDPLRDRSD